MNTTVKHRDVETPLILTLDVGTSSSRAMLFDRHLRPVEEGLVQVAHELQTTPDGGAELDPAELLAGVVEAIEQLLEQAGPLADQIGGVAMDTLVSNVMGLDADGRPVTPIFTYADTRSAPDAETLRQEVDMAAAYQRTGCRIHSSYLPARFHWLERTRPDLLQAAAHWVSIGEYLGQVFLGQRTVSYSVASWTGLLNRHSLAWDQEWLSRLPIDEEHLSPLGDINRPLTGLVDQWAERWPPLAKLPWFPAIGDGAAANIGSGCRSPERVALTIGTSGAMRVVLEEDIDQVPDGLWVYRVDGRRALLGGATTEGGNLFAWLNDTLQLPPEAEAEAQLAQMPPAAHGLTVLPFVAGERAPGWHDEARASLIGFSLNTSPMDILRAGLESIAYRFALIHDRIKPHLPAEHQVVASGAGLLSSPAWLQIMADVLGRPLTTSGVKEATSRGVSLLALESLELLQADPTLSGDTYHPHRENHKKHRQALDRQVEAYNKLVAG